MSEKVKNIGLIGFGKLGQYLLDQFYYQDVNRDKINICFIWNRSPIPQDKIPKDIKILKSIDEFDQYDLDLIVEVAHPNIIKTWGQRFLQKTNLFISSSTVFCDHHFEKNFLKFATNGPNCLILAKGALSGLHDLLELADHNSIEKLSIKMVKAPESIKFEGPLPAQNEKFKHTNLEPLTLFKGPVRQLAQYAPNNVNTMVLASLASGLGLDKVEGELIASPGLKHHEVTWTALVTINSSNQPLKIQMTKINPASSGSVTGQFTYQSFRNSILKFFHTPKNTIMYC